MVIFPQWHAFFLAWQISDLCQQKENYFVINLPLCCVSVIKALYFLPTTREFSFDEQIWNKERAAGYQRVKVPTQSPSFTEQGSSFHLTQYSTYAYYGLQGWNWRVNIFSKYKNIAIKSLLKRLLCVSMCVCGGGPIRCFYLLRMSRWRCLQSTAGVRTLYQCITAALQFSLSLCHCSQLNLSGSLFELYIQRMFLILGENGLPQR